MVHYIKGQWRGMGGRQSEREKMFYLTTHSTHFIYGYMASDIWLRTILIVRKETRCRHIGYSYRLTARVLLYAPSHRQDNTYHGLCYTSRGALAGTRRFTVKVRQRSVLMVHYIKRSRQWRGTGRRQSHISKQTWRLKIKMMSNLVLTRGAARYIRGLIGLHVNPNHTRVPFAVLVTTRHVQIVFGRS